MTQRPGIDRARLREPGSAILREFRQAMELRRAGGFDARPNMARNFQAADGNAFTAGWSTWSASINAILQSAHTSLVARSRTWGRNTGAGRRFLSQVRDGGVGPVGYTLKMRCGDWRQEKGKWVFRIDKPANDAIERAFLDWCQPGNCEVTGRLSFADVCKLQLEMAARDGEYLARHLRGTKATKHRYQLQLLATERLDVAHNETPAFGPEVRMGVHRDDTGRATAYSILRSNPGESRGTRAAEIVAASDVLHDFITLEPEQARGVPWSHAVLMGANMLAQFQNFAVFAAQAGASQMGFFTQPAEAQLPITPGDLGATANATTGELSKSMAPGALDLLPPGIDFKPFIGQYPSEAFDPFVLSVKRDMSSGLNVAHHNLTGDMSRVNYSSARIAELAERDHWRGVAHWFIGSFVFPVFRSWLEMALLANQVTLANGQPLSVSRMDKYLAGVCFQGRGWAWVDPLKEATANALARQEGFTTRTQVVGAQGGDFEDNVAEIAGENQLLADYNVQLGAPQSAAPNSAAADQAAQDQADQVATGKSKALQRALDLINSEGETQ